MSDMSFIILGFPSLLFIIQRTIFLIKGTYAIGFDRSMEILSFILNKNVVNKE